MRQRVADSANKQGRRQNSGILQRACACDKHTGNGGECEECRQKRLGTLQRAAVNSASGSAEAPPIVHEVLRSPGQPLDVSTRAYMEPRFGHDFSGVRVSNTDPVAHIGSLRIGDSADRSEHQADRTAANVVGGDVAGSGNAGPDFSGVRVHTDSQASVSANDVAALAYTVGSHIVFGPGQYAPSTTEGRLLIAHELAHVAGQNIGEGQRVQRKGGTFGGFLANIGRGIADLFGAEPDYDSATLQAYLKTLNDTNDIEDDFDSDNKARVVVGQGLHQTQSISIKLLLIREMLTGYFSDDDHDAILTILHDAKSAELEAIVGDSRLAAGELDRLYAIFPAFASIRPRGDAETETWKVEDFIEKWEKDHGRSMTPEERATLARGCIGITALELGPNGLPNPSLSTCYGSFGQAWDAKTTMDEFLRNHFPDRRALLFSKRFWSSGNPYTPDPATGQVDMSGYGYETRPMPDMTNFDYGLYDEKSGKWWHANHSEPDMKVYESNLQHYSRPLLDFDRQVFCVGISNLN